jgi:hydrogenase large subunit
MMANATILPKSGGLPAAAPAHVLAVDAGQAGCYYPGILNGVDNVLAGVLSIPLYSGGTSPVGVMPAWGQSLSSTVLNYVVIPGVNDTPSIAPVLYVGPNSVSLQALSYAHDYSGVGTLDRIAARALETYYVAAQMLSWFNAIDPNATTCVTKSWGAKQACGPKKGHGAGLTEAPRGALAHWIKVGVGKNHPKYNKLKRKVHRYQIITPTAWNISPKDHNGAEGPMEKCIINTPLVSETEPLEILRVIHSFDPCCACTVHLTNVKKEKVFKATLEALI